MKKTNKFLSFRRRQNKEHDRKAGMKLRFFILLGAIVISVVTYASAEQTPEPAPQTGELKLADPFGDEMVLQQGMPVPIWGVVAPGAAVTVDFAGQTQTAKADARGRWKVKLAPLVASAENRTLTIVSDGHKLEVKDVLVGEVWICSGQSNMEFGVPMVADAQAEIAAADYPNIRLRVVNKVMATLPLTHIDGSPWRVCTPATIVQGTYGGFSAAAYYFGRDLHRELKVPVGLIQSCWGGTAIEPWIAAEGYRGEPALKTQSASLDKAQADYLAAIPAYLEAVAAWEKDARANLQDGTPLTPAPLLNHPLQNGGNTTLYNAMIAPWTGFPVRGAIWYQGESNCIQNDGAAYFDKMQALVAGWRKVWGRKEGDFPFYFAQIAPFRYRGFGNGVKPMSLPELWEAQNDAAQKIPNTGMSHTQDIGALGDIHPKNKQDVGHRLARLALARTYSAKEQGGAPITDDCGPEFQSLETKEGSLIVKFSHAKSGLASRDGKPLSNFEIAGNDGQFKPAEAKIKGDAVLLSSPQVPAPSQVRFGWNEEAEPNLINGDKLPAATFRAPRPQ